MERVIVLAEGAVVPGNVSLDGALVWDKTTVPAGQRSVPACCQAHWPQWRRELLALVYELGRARVDGVEVQEQLKAGDSLSMWWCSLLFEKHPKVTPELYPALKLRALEYMLGGKEREAASAHEPAPEQAVWQELRLYGGNATLAQCLRDYCAAWGRSFVHVPGRSDGEADGSTGAAERTGAASGTQAGLKVRLRRAYYALPGPCKAALRLGAWLWQSRALLRGRVQPRPQESCGTIATYFPNVDLKAAEAGRFRSRYWEDLHAALRSDWDAATGTPTTAAGEAKDAACAPVNWLFIRFPSPQASLAQCLDMRDRFRQAQQDGRSFHYLEEFLGWKDVLAAIARYVRLATRAKALESAVRPLFRLGFADAPSRMDVWPWLGPYWQDSFGGWRCLERCLQRRALQNYVRWAGPQRWTIFPMENCPWERMLTEAVHAAGHGPVYGTQHSTVRPTDLRYFDDVRAFAAADCQAFQPDSLYGNGQGACAEMLAAGTPVQRVGMVEALRYMYLSGRVDQAPAEVPLPCARLLVVTSFFADEVEAHLRVLARWMREEQATSAAAGWEVCVKPHPYLAVEGYVRDFFPQGGAPRVLDQPIGELLTPGTAVWASNSTTVALEAALMGLPVMVQLPENDVDLCPLQNVPGVARIVHAADVSAALTVARKAQLPPDYLALNPALPLWRRLLGISS